MSKIKKFFTVIASIIIALFLKTGNVFAEIQIPTATLYGIPRDPEQEYRWLKVLLIVLIPVVIIIGIVTIIRCRTKKPKANTKPNTNVENNNENKQG